MLRGETVEGIRLPKLTLDGAEFKQLAVGNWGGDSITQTLNVFLQLELVGDSSIAYDETYRGEGAVESLDVYALCITGSGTLNVTAPAEMAAGFPGTGVSTGRKAARSPSRQESKAFGMTLGAASTLRSTAAD